MDELVRDFVPALASLEDAELHFDVAPPGELTELAMEKVIELAQEWKAADPEMALEKLAGMYELLLLITEQSGVSPMDVAALALQRDLEKGGYHYGFVLKEE